MTHEPECPIGNNNAPLTFYAARQGVAIVCVCANIRAAYQRGREDAADIVNVAIGNNGPLFDQAKQNDVIAWWNKTVAAARWTEDGTNEA